MFISCGFMSCLSISWKGPYTDTALTSLATFYSAASTVSSLHFPASFGASTVSGNFFLLSLHQDSLFQQIIHSYNKHFIFTNGVRIYLLSKISHGMACHSIPNFPPWLSVIICTGIRTYQLVMLTQKSLGFLLDKSFHPTRLCFIHLSQKPYHPKFPYPATCSEL